MLNKMKKAFKELWDENQKFYHDFYSHYDQLFS